MQRSRARGVAALYMIVIMVALCAFCSLGVDFGRVQIVKTELRRAADAAARAAASQMKLGRTFAVNKAVEYAGYNKADATPVVLTAAQDIEFGTWNPSSKKLKVVTSNDISSCNAVRVVARRVASRGTSVPMMFARVLGQNSCDVEAETITQVVFGVNINDDIPATANPFLSGMPAGSIASVNNPHKSPDYAGTLANPRQSPWQVNLPLSDGTKLNFDSISGDARHDPNQADYAPDGQLDDIGTNTAGAENGISNLRSPINALVGVFLTDDKPNTTSAPSMLDFSTDASREFKSLSPKLKQLFFIGDGTTKNGGKQDFIVPAGATRLYLATWDFYEWNNNSGQRRVKISLPDRIMTVK